MTTSSPHTLDRATGNFVTLDALEPRGTRIQLHDLLRWRLAASFIPLENRNNSSPLVGNRRSALRGRGIDFDEVRLYQPGDDVRSIDWRVTARTGKAHTKLFHEEKERPVLLVLDLRSTMFFGSRRCFKSVLAAHAAALLAWATLAAGDRLGAILISDNAIIDIRPQRHRRALMQIFRQIVALDRAHDIQHSASASALHWQHAMHQLRTVIRPGSCVVMLSDFHDWDSHCQQALYPVVRHSQCFALHIYDSLEKNIPAIGLVNFYNGLRKASIDTQQTKLLDSFQKKQQQHRQDLEKSMLALRIPLLSLQTNESIFSALRQFFTAGGKWASNHEQQ